MKNHQKGFIGILILVIVALGLAGGGYYVINKKEGAKDANPDLFATSTATVQAEGENPSGDANIKAESQISLGADAESNVQSAITYIDAAKYRIDNEFIPKFDELSTLILNAKKKIPESSYERVDMAIQQLASFRLAAIQHSTEINADINLLNALKLKIKNNETISTSDKALYERLGSIKAKAGSYREEIKKFYEDFMISIDIQTLKSYQ